MATIVTSSIGSAGGRDYSTIQAWEDACPANLVTADQVWKGECYNDSEFAPFTISGQTTDATRYVWLTTATGQSFLDHASATTNPLTYDQTKGVGVRFTAIYGNCFAVGADIFATIEKIQFCYAQVNANGYNQPVVMTANTTIKNFIYYSIRQGNSTIRYTGGTMINGLCIADCNYNQGPAGGGKFFESNSNSLHGTFINCTVVVTSRWTAGICFRMRYAGYPTVINCAVFGFNTPFDGTLASYLAGTGYNASSVVSGSMPGSNNQASLTYNDQFVTTITTETSPGSGVGLGNCDFRPKAGANLFGTGQRQQAFTGDKDIILASRSTTAPTIGAKENTGAANTGGSSRWLLPH